MANTIPIKPEGRPAPGAALPCASAAAATLAWTWFPLPSTAGIVAAFVFILVINISAFNIWFWFRNSPGAAHSPRLLFAAAMYQWAALAIAATACRLTHAGLWTYLLVSVLLLTAGMVTFRIPVLIPYWLAWRRSSAGRLVGVAIWVLFAARLFKASLAPLDATLTSEIIIVIAAIWVQISAAHWWHAYVRLNRQHTGGSTR